MNIHAELAPGPAILKPETLEDWRAKALELQRNVGSVVIGQDTVVRLITVALFARGHVLLEGDVGVGKTTVLRAFARAIGGEFERIEGTIDLMPGDLLYQTYVDAQGRPRIEPGPLLRHEERLTTFFFNEINRARPQVQSLLLRAMAERTVSAFNREYRFPHMTVFADRNRIEREETFELASAARDRFLFELNMSTPDDEAIRKRIVFDPAFHDADELVEHTSAGLLSWQQMNAVGVAIQQYVQTSEAIERYVLELWRATEAPHRHGIRIDGVDTERLVLAGASPRGMSALVRAARVNAWLAGRDWLTPEDVCAVLPAALGHRVFFAPVYELRRAELSAALMDAIRAHVPAP